MEGTKGSVLTSKKISTDQFCHEKKMGLNWPFEVLFHALVWDSSTHRETTGHSKQHGGSKAPRYENVGWPTGQGAIGNHQSVNDEEMKSEQFEHDPVVGDCNSNRRGHYALGNSRDYASYSATGGMLTG